VFFLILPDLAYFFRAFVNAESSSRSHTERIGRSWLVLPCDIPDEPAVDDPQF
jgi:hypothetical protein